MVAAWFRLEPEPRHGLQPVLIDQERELIEAALAESGGRISGPDGAARRLGVPRTTLEYKIKSLRINKYQYRFDAREFSSKLDLGKWGANTTPLTYRQSSHG